MDRWRGGSGPVRGLAVLLVCLAAVYRQTSAYCLYGDDPGCAFQCHCKETSECGDETSSCPSGCATASLGHNWRGPGCQIGNVGLHKEAYTTGSIGRFPPRAALDGVVPEGISGACSHPKAATGQPAEWWTDLGGLYNISSISIYGRTNCCESRLQQFELTVYNTTDNEVLCAYQNDIIYTSKTIQCDAPVVGRFVHFKRTGGPEIEVTTLYCSQCPSGVSCNDVTGCVACDGKYQPDCVTACEPGSYGTNCVQRCGQCREGTSCDKNNGVCPDGCELWYIDDKCATYVDKPNRTNETTAPPEQTSSSIVIRWQHLRDVPSELRPFYFYSIQQKIDPVIAVYSSNVDLSGYTEAGVVAYVNEPFTNITDLDFNTKYSVIILPFRELSGTRDYGVPYPTMSVKTNCTYPKEPLILNITKLESFISVIFEKGESNCEQISNVYVHYKPPSKEHFEVNDLSISDTNFTIVPVESGTYQIKILVENNEGYKTSSEIHYVHISVPGDAHTGLPVAVIAGSVAALVAVLVVVIVLVLLLLRRKRADKRSHDNTEHDNRGLNIGTDNETEEAIIVDQHVDPPDQIDVKSTAPILGSMHPNPAKPIMKVAPITPSIEPESKMNIYADIEDSSPDPGVCASAYTDTPDPDRRSQVEIPASNEDQVANKKPTTNLEAASHRPVTIMPDETDPPVKGSISKEYEAQSKAEASATCDVLTEQEECLYANSSVAAVNFEGYVARRKANLEDLFKEYRSLPQPDLDRCEAALTEINNLKNRFKNIYAYDETRVHLDGDEDNEYINANYITGYNKTKEYIATQGPTKHTVADFWRMMWDERANRIIMVANVDENGKKRISPYWPNKMGDILVKEDFTVTTESLEVTADYTTRIMSLRNKNETRTVRQFHFTTWEDKNKPVYGPISLLSFCTKVHSFDRFSKGPMVVHCSAGVGRTGTFIALDILKQMVTKDESLDIYNCVQRLRNERMHMVQTKEQYVFLHDVLVEFIKYGSKAHDCQEFANKFATIRDTQPVPALMTEIQQEYKLVSQLKKPQIDTTKDGLLSVNVDKNRNTEIVPDETERLYLQGKFNYINAVYVDSFKAHNAYVVTQMPLPHTMADFWQLVVEQECRTIIMLNQVDKADKAYWPDQEHQPQKYGRILVELVSISSDSIKDYIIIREFKVMKVSQKNVKDPSVLRVRHLQLLSWPQSDDLPENRGHILDLIDLQQSWQQQHNVPADKWKSLVHCLDGGSHSGMFCGASFTLDLMKVEQHVDAFLAVRYVMRRRQEFFNKLIEYQFLYQMALESMTKYNEYANFQ